MTYETQRRRGAERQRGKEERRGEERRAICVPLCSSVIDVSVPGIMIPGSLDYL
jgi:hypothetical protein